MTIDEIIGENLLRIRTKIGLSQRDMAVKLGLKGQTTYSMVESGRTKLKVETLYRIKEQFGYTIDSIFKKEFKP